MPAEVHPTSDDLREFVAGGLPPAGTRRVVRHLLSGCEACRRATSGLWPPAGDTPPELLADAVGRAAARAAAREDGVERERRAAAGLLEELESLPPSRQLLLVLNSRRYHNWFLCEALLEKAFEAGFEDPGEAVRRAETATALAGRLADADGAQPVTQDLAARAWATLGNARRIHSDLAGAQEALDRAAGYLEYGSGDPLEEAGVASKLGHLRHKQRRFDDAIRLYDRALRVSRLGGDRHLEGRILTLKATTVGDQGRLPEMIGLLRRSLTLLDPEREPRLMLVAQHNLTWALSESGRLDEALGLMQEILPLHARSGKTMDLLRMRWLEGKLAQAQGELTRAEAGFREVLDGFIQVRVPFDAALAALDLAAVYCEQGRLAEMKKLAAESVPVFRSLGVHREALAALVLFQQAAEMERISLRWLAELAGYLQRARRDPSLSFKPSV